MNFADFFLKEDMELEQSEIVEKVMELFKDFNKYITDLILDVKGVELNFLDCSKITKFDFIKGHFSIPDYMFLENSNINEENFYKLSLKKNTSRLIRMIGIISLLLEKFKIYNNSKNINSVSNQIFTSGYFSNNFFEYKNIPFMEDQFNKIDETQISSDLKNPIILVSKREIYYSNVNIFKNMQNIDIALEDISNFFYIPKIFLPISTCPKGEFFTNIILKYIDEYEEIKFLNLPNKISLINYNCLFYEFYSDIDCKYKFCDYNNSSSEQENCNNSYSIANSTFMKFSYINKHNNCDLIDFILIVEKDTVFQSLVNNSFFLTNFKNYFIITSRGYPDISTRMFINKICDFYNELRSYYGLGKVKLLYFGDWDVYGIEIYFNYCFGSKYSSFDNRFISIKGINWIGVLSDQIEERHLMKINVTDEENENFGFYDNSNDIEQDSNNDENISIINSNDFHSKSTTQETNYSNESLYNLIGQNTESNRNLNKKLSIEDKYIKRIDNLLKSDFFNISEWKKSISQYLKEFEIKVEESNKLNNNFSNIKQSEEFESMYNNMISFFNELETTIKSVDKLKNELLIMKSIKMKVEADSIVLNCIEDLIQIIKANIY